MTRSKPDHPPLSRSRLHRRLPGPPGDVTSEGPLGRALPYYRKTNMETVTKEQAEAAIALVERYLRGERAKYVAEKPHTYASYDPPSARDAFNWAYRLNEAGGADNWSDLVPR